MAVGISTYLANKLLDHAFRNVDYTNAANIYAKLHTGDPGAAGTSNASAQTTRVDTNFSAAASGTITMSNDPEFTLNATETITHVSFWDASSGGNFLYSVAASVSRGSNSGDIIRLDTHSITFTPVAS